MLLALVNGLMFLSFVIILDREVSLILKF